MLDRASLSLSAVDSALWWQRVYLLTIKRSWI